jgi:hypothetical protein
MNLKKSITSKLYQISELQYNVRQNQRKFLGKFCQISGFFKLPFMQRAQYPIIEFIIIHISTVELFKGDFNHSSTYLKVVYRLAQF